MTLTRPQHIDVTDLLVFPLEVVVDGRHLEGDLVCCVWLVGLQDEDVEQAVERLQQHAGRFLNIGHSSI